MILRVADFCKIKTLLFLVIDRKEIKPHVIVTSDVPRLAIVFINDPLTAAFFLLVPVDEKILGLERCLAVEPVLLKLASLFVKE